MKLEGFNLAILKNTQLGLSMGMVRWSNKGQTKKEQTQLTCYTGSLKPQVIQSESHLCHSSVIR